VANLTGTQVLLTPRIEASYHYFCRNEGKPPNVLLISPENNWNLQQEMIASGAFLCADEREQKIPQFHGMRVYITHEVKDFRLGWMLNSDGA
jgi:hypothetical protein